MQENFVEHTLIRPETVEARSFQVKLAKSVLKGGNSIVVAPTALGKTIVAVLVMADRLEKEPQKKILFLAPTKPLCEQHKKTIEKLMQIQKEESVLLTGTIASGKRAREWEKARIIAATPQTIENDVRNERIGLEGVSLIVFDEAHRAVGEYAYVYIAKKFAKKNPNGLVLALTASPGGREAHIKEVCSNLGIKNIEIKGLEDEDVIPYSHEIRIGWKTVELPLEFKAMKSLIEHFMKKQAETIHKFGLSRTTSLSGFGKGRLIEMQNTVRRRIVSSNGKNPSLFSAASAIASMMKASHAHTLLETQGVNALHDYLERETGKKGKVSRATKNFLESMEIAQVKEKAAELSAKGIVHPKFEALSGILEKQFRENPKSSAIVFNHYRDSIKRLVLELNRIPRIRAERFVGQASKEKEKGMSQKEQAERIKELGEGKLNCLVASSVAEEGLDIPSVDLVVFYEPVPSEIRYIQRRGRTGRLAAGKAIILMARNTRDEAYYWTSISKEKKMHRILRRMKQGKGAWARGGDSGGQAFLFKEAESLEKNGFSGEAETRGEPAKEEAHELPAAKEREGENGNEESEAESTLEFNSLEDEELGLAKPDGREKQTTLYSFQEGSEEIVVYADSRERESSIPKMLEELGCRVVEKQLETGDYVPGKEIIVERKSVSDFLSSIVDGRLSKQLLNMSESYERPVLFVEGDKDELFNSRNIHRNAVIGMLTSIALNYQVPILFTDSARETAQYIFVIAKREQQGKGTDVRLRLGRKGLALGEQQRFVVESLPLVGPQMARKLLKKFGSVKGIVNAQSKELQEIDNMGQKKAKLVRKVLLSKYEGEE